MTNTPLSPEVAKAKKEQAKKLEKARTLIQNLAWRISEDELLALGQFIEKRGIHGVVETLCPECQDTPRIKFQYSHYIQNPYLHIERCNLMQDAKRYIINIELDGEGQLPFKVCRRFEVPSNMWMEEFGPLVIEIMGWNNSHLHAFIQDGREYVCQRQYRNYLEHSLVDEEQADISYNTMTVMDFLKTPGDSIRFLYDFGDSWQHVITLEEVTDYEPDTPHPSLILEGENTCPPDDCGGVFGYAQLLSIISDRKHPEYKEYKQWLPRGFKPDMFDDAKQNRKLKKLGF